MTAKEHLATDVEEMVAAFRDADKQGPGPGFVIAHWLGQEGAEPPDWWAPPAKRVWQVLAALVCDAGLMGPGLHDDCAATGCRFRKEVRRWPPDR